MAEKEYIERGALLTDEMTHTLPYSCGRSAGRMVVFVDDIEAIPAADVVEVRHGEWIDKSKYINGGLYAPRVDCSVCEHIFWHLSAQTYNYCPHCGAKMDGERKEQK